MKQLLVIAVLLLCLPAGAAERPRDSEGAGGEHRPFSDVEYWAGVFEDESRKAWQMPLTVLEFLGIRKGETVADLGAGTGYFTRMLALEVGDEGRVYAVEIEQAMLDYLTRRDDIRQDRVTSVLAEPDDPKLPKGEIDLVVIMNTWHHVEKRTRYLKKLARSLSEEGRVAIIDFYEGELPVGPPPGHKLSEATVEKELRKAGWTVAAKSVALPYQYLMIAKPPSRR